MKPHRVIFWTAFIFWIAESWWFGWNSHPATHAEAVCDSIARILFYAAVFLWLNRRVVVIFITETSKPVTITGTQRVSVNAKTGEAVK